MFLKIRRLVQKGNLNGHKDSWLLKISQTILAHYKLVGFRRLLWALGFESVVPTRLLIFCKLKSQTSD